MGQVLKQQLTAHGLDNIKKVVFTIASGKLATREVRLPPSRKSSLRL